MKTKISSLFRGLSGHRIFFGFLAITLFAITTISSLYISANPAHADVDTALTTHHKQLRTIVKKHFKAACTSSSPTMPRCAAEVVVNNSNQPVISGQPAASDDYGPAQFHTAYNLPCTPGGPVASICSTPTTFGPQIIAIVDQGGYGGSGTIEGNLSTFDSYYGLPACTTANGCLSIVNDEDQSSPLPSPDGSDPSGWADEMNLDVQTAHMICQTCQIVLYESASILVGLNTAATDGSTSVSNSWFIYANGTQYDSYVEHTGVAIVAATGDSGSDESIGAYPADNPDVVAASGTTLETNTDNTWAGETVWSGSGGGCATDSSDVAPSWQTSLSNWSTAGCGTYRAVGDMSADADPNTGAYIYLGDGWGEYGGTSLATPIIASIFALAGGVPSNTYAPEMLYQNFNSLNSHNITTGNDCTAGVTTHCTAGVGYSTPPGLGSPNGIDAFEAQPLTTPGYLTATDTSQTSINLSWIASTSTYGVAGYDIYRNDVLLGSTTSTSYTDNGLTPNTTYNYSVNAYDNSSDDSLSATTTGTTLYPEDINGDGHINLLDLSILANNWGESEPAAGRADIKGYGQVDLLDLSLLAQYYGVE